MCFWAFARCSSPAGPAAMRSCCLPDLPSWGATVAAFCAPAPPELAFAATCVYAALLRAKDCAIRSLHNREKRCPAGVVHRPGLQAPCTCRHASHKASMGSPSTGGKPEIGCALLAGVPVRLVVPGGKFACPPLQHIVFIQELEQVRHSAPISLQSLDKSLWMARKPQNSPTTASHTRKILADSRHNRGYLAGICISSLASYSTVASCPVLTSWQNRITVC